MGLLVGQTEAQVRQRCGSPTPCMPCILFCDELEKGLPASPQAATATRASRPGSSALLTWLSDHESDVFVGTSNDVSRLPPEFSRAAERLDADLLPRPPRRARRSGSGRCTQRGPGSTPASVGPATASSPPPRSGSCCCRLAALLDIPLGRGGLEHRPGGRSTAGEARFEEVAILGGRAAACLPTVPASTPAPRTPLPSQAATSDAATLRPTDSRALEPRGPLLHYSAITAEMHILALDSANCANCANSASRSPSSGTGPEAPLVAPPHHPFATARRSHVRPNHDHRPRFRPLAPYDPRRPAGGGRRLRPEAAVARRGDRRRGRPAGPEPRRSTPGGHRPRRSPAEAAAAWAMRRSPSLLPALDRADGPRDPRRAGRGASCAAGTLASARCSPMSCSAGPTVVQPRAGCSNSSPPGRHVADVLVRAQSRAGLEGCWIITGDALLAVDMSKAEVRDRDETKRETAARSSCPGRPSCSGASQSRQEPRQ